MAIENLGSSHHASVVRAYDERKKEVKKTVCNTNFTVKDKSNTFYANFLMMKGEKVRKKVSKKLCKCNIFPGKICRNVSNSMELLTKYVP